MKKIATQITLDIEKLSEGKYLATSRDVQGLVAQGKTFEETVEIAKDIAIKLIRAQIHSHKKALASRDGHIVYPLLLKV